MAVPLLTIQVKRMPARWQLEITAFALLLFWLRVRRFQIADQPLKRFLIRVVILPVAEVRDEILANLAGGIFSGVGVEALPVAQSFNGASRMGNSTRRWSRTSRLRALAISVFTHSLSILCGDRINSSLSCRRMASSICSWSVLPDCAGKGSSIRQVTDVEVNLA